MYIASMNRLSIEKRTQIISCLVDGCSIRATTRITGAAKNTVIKLLTEVGQASREYQDKTLRNLQCKRIEVDEIWTFCHAKEKNVPEDLKGKFGFENVWTWTAICPDTKLVPSWMVGGRDSIYAYAFINDLAERMASRIQLTSDGHQPYLEAVERAFGDDIDYAILLKHYGKPQEEKRYSPPKFIKTSRKTVVGNPDPKHVSTAIAERQNWTMRTFMLRFNRLSFGFSRKVENLNHAVSLHFMYYNFVKIHGTLGVTPALEAGVTDRLWSIEDLVKLAD